MSFIRIGQKGKPMTFKDKIKAFLLADDVLTLLAIKRFTITQQLLAGQNR